MDEKTRRELAEIAAQEAALAERKRRLLHLAKEQIADDAKLVGAERAAFLGLTGGATGRIVSTMDVDGTGQSEAVKRGIARGRRNHPAQVAFYENGVTIKDVAAELRETRARVSAWMSADPKAVRAIPSRHAEHLKRRFGIPLSAWARIAD